jgi:hypothetical protein
MVAAVLSISIRRTPPAAPSPAVEAAVGRPPSPAEAAAASAHG